jgi:hypothetical protein
MGLLSAMPLPPFHHTCAYYTPIAPEMQLLAKIARMRYNDTD